MKFGSEGLSFGAVRENDDLTMRELRPGGARRWNGERGQWPLNAVSQYIAFDGSLNLLVLHCSRCSKQVQLGAEKLAKLTDLMRVPDRMPTDGTGSRVLPLGALAALAQMS